MCARAENVILSKKNKKKAKKRWSLNVLTTKLKETISSIKVARNCILKH